MVCPKDISTTDPDFEYKLVLFAASNIESEEDITDAFYTCGLKEDEGMKVLGGGSIEIEHDSEAINVATISQTFGPAKPELVEKVLKESYEDYKIHFVSYYFATCRLNRRH